jgi:diguanylate cyclase (GGDEF)-like protein
MEKAMEFSQSQESLKKRISELIENEDGANRRYYQAQITELSKKEDRIDRFFSSLLEVFVHLEFEEADAIAHWAEIVKHAEALSASLARQVGIHLTIVDYFTNINKLLKQPMLIEIHVFKQTERMAMVDGLTGVFNRRYMEIALKKEYNRCARYRKNLSVFILDIDNFKKLNDERGHVYGDVVLKETAAFLKGIVREEDVVCRYGGEEFLIILPETSGQGAYKLAERMRVVMKDSDFFKESKVTFSGGTATFPESGNSVMEIVGAADKALYRAKYAGKDRVLQAIPERRLHSRFPRSWSLDLLLKVDSKGAVHQPPKIRGTDIVTQNVSRGGVRFECAVRLDIDEVLQLEFKALDSSNERVSAVGTVSWAKKDGEDHFCYGVRFTELSAEASDLLSESLPSDDFLDDPDAEAP